MTAREDRFACDYWKWTLIAAAMAIAAIMAISSESRLDLHISSERQIMAKSNIVKPPTFEINAAQEDALPIIKAAILQARRRGDTKAALEYAEIRTRFINWIEDQRAREADAIRAAKALPIAKVSEPERSDAHATYVESKPAAKKHE